MFCETWHSLFEQFESASLQRVQKKKGVALVVREAELESLDGQIVDALHRLREHEDEHCCH